MTDAKTILFKLNIDWQVFLTNPQEMCLQMIKEGMREGIKASAEVAEVENEGTYNGAGESTDYYTVDKKSILNLLNEIK